MITKLTIYTTTDSRKNNSINCTNIDRIKKFTSPSKSFNLDLIFFYYLLSNKLLLYIEKNLISLKKKYVNKKEKCDYY